MKQKLLGIFILISLFNASAKDVNSLPRLLIKIPTRSRPAQFFKNLDKYYQHMSFEYPYEFLISCDEDDISMNNENIIKRLQSYPNLKFYFARSNSKVEAINRDIEKCDFDILLVASDDMETVAKHYDKILINHMQKNFPDGDGVLNFNDGHVAGQCNTLPVIGKRFYDRFQYVFNPAYKAFECNVELTLISKMLKKEFLINDVIIRHNHPAWGAGNWDDLYEKNHKFYQEDKITFATRRSNNFDLSDEMLFSVTPKDLSILICTLDERESLFSNLFNKLQKQIKDLNLEDKVEVLFFKDNRENSIGYKRNFLVEQACGKYICFADDDDDVHDQYVKMLYDKIQSRPDCVSLTGTITFNGQQPKLFIHSIAYDHYSQDAQNYYRPPNHLNAIKRSIAVQFQFPEKYYGEDFDWAMEVCRSGLLKKEETINEPYYFYLYDGNKKTDNKKIISFFKAKNAGVMTSEFFQFLKEFFNPEVFIETGTFYAQTTLRSADYFREIHTIELDTHLYRNAINTLKGKSNVFVHNGDSKFVLDNLLPNLKNKKLLFFLDAHWSGDGTAKGDENTPIIHELEIIKKYGITDATILIDDMRFFQSDFIMSQQNYVDPNDSSVLGYSSLTNLKKKLLEINPAYKIIIFGDIGIAYVNPGNIIESSVIQAMTISRFFNDNIREFNNSEYEKILAAEKIISSCQGVEKDAIADLALNNGFHTTKLLFWHYKLWYALTLFGSDEKDQAVHQLHSLIKLGLNCYRVHNYLE